MIIQFIVYTLNGDFLSHFSRWILMFEAISPSKNHKICRGSSMLMFKNVLIKDLSKGNCRGLYYVKSIPFQMRILHINIFRLKVRRYNLTKRMIRNCFAQRPNRNPIRYFIFSFLYDFVVQWNKTHWIVLKKTIFITTNTTIK